jgi:hypothetical protein
MATAFAKQREPSLHQAQITSVSQAAPLQQITLAQLARMRWFRLMVLTSVLHLVVWRAQALMT